METKAKAGNALTLFIPLADALLEDVEVVARRRLKVALQQEGVPDGTPVQVTILPTRYGFDVTAIWAKSELSNDG